MKKKHILFTILVLFFIISSCKSIPLDVDQEWSEENFFVMAQDASDDGYYDTALYYYNVYQIRYPENIRKNLAADYEKAFIHYKMEDYDTATEMFNSILERYETSPYAMFFGERYKILSELVLNKMQEGREKKNIFSNFGRRKRETE